MTIKKVDIGHTVIQYDNATTYAADGAAIQGIRVQEQIKVETAPTHDQHVVRLQDLNDAVFESGAIVVGLLSARPDPNGDPGWYYATDTTQLYYSDGTTWFIVSNVRGGLHASRPSAASENTFWYSTDIKLWFRDNGSAWVTIPTFSEGALADRPAAGYAGRWYYTTDQNTLYHDSGSAWFLVSNIIGGLESQKPAAASSVMVFWYSRDKKRLQFSDGVSWTPIGTIAADVFASRPTAGEAGRFFFATDSQAMYYDTGAAWSTVSQLTFVTVADITDPDTELSTLSNATSGPLIVARETESNADTFTLYAWDAAVGSGASSPYIVAGTGGYWVAVGGRYVNGAQNVSGALAVTGNLSTSGTLAATGNITTSGNVTATGDVSANDGTFSGNVGVTGNVTAADGTFSGDLAASGDADVVGTLTVNTDAVVDGSVTAQSYLPETSGTTNLGAVTTGIFDKVFTNKIGNTATNAIAIESDGSVTMAAQPFASAYASASQELTSGTPAKVQCNTEVVDVGADYNNTTYAFTAPKAGIYLIIGNVTIEANATGSRALYIYVDDTLTIQSTVIPAGSAVNVTIPVMAMISLAANAVVDIRAWQDSGGALDTVATNPEMNRIMIAKIA